MTNSKKVRRPKGEPPVPNPQAEANAEASMEGKEKSDLTKVRRPKGEPPVTNAGAEAKAKVKAKDHGKPAYVVAEGVEVPSLRGLLKAGDEVLPRYLRGGVKVLTELVRQKLLVRK